MKYELRAHQKEFVEFFNKSRFSGQLAYHEMGLGKTLTALHISLKYTQVLKDRGVSDDPKVLILCPKIIESVWCEHIGDFMPDSADRFIILPYSQLKNARDIPRHNDFRFVILDEFHYLRNTGTQRLGFFTDLLNELHWSEGGFQFGRYIGLTGTPLVNSGADLFSAFNLFTAKNALEAANNISSENRQYQWKNAFTNRYKTHFGVKYEGVRNKKKLVELTSPFIHHKRLAECVDMPEMSVNHIDLKLRDDDLLQDVDINSPDAYMSVLEALSRAKTPHLIKRIKDFLETGEQCVVFSMHKEAIHQLAKDVEGVGIITGGISSEERTATIKAFKDGKIRVIAMTYACGAEGLNLQHCRYAFYHSYPWTYAQFEQAKARIHRPGQKNKTIHYIIISGKNDLGILSTVMKKRRNMEYFKENI